jgi:hypothetical protein
MRSANGTSDPKTLTNFCDTVGTGERPNLMVTKPKYFYQEVPFYHLVIVTTENRKQGRSLGHPGFWYMRIL